jgi:metal-responsive CopG/Arc/MetJ family transcriptional regulator
MTQEETAITLKLPKGLADKLDTIARQKYLQRNDIIIDACAYYCQYYDMNHEQVPETTRNIFFNLARHDNEFRQTLRDVLKDGMANDDNQNK